MAHADVDNDDVRLMALHRYITNLCESGEQDPIALQKAGLAHLHRLDQLVQSGRSDSRDIEL
ncbi:MULTISPECIES: hypothetical protein [unclassified Bradyrhizobium]|uniref:hypothetical protein n=1 Tax=unclassified Bradyrhizobium TaxID=2631580 RepID=UPI002478C26B|nr:MULTISPECIES: hypothetical protein [unclassified Bradyrhizobium]WGS23008.1 hypothetical protein MTX22_16015 [Bradyrhizobium sp. ISRA463]WGS30007.1 hypothetical protein MTX19_13740 [Bradyrhizobium sp. ISRA464]